MKKLGITLLVLFAIALVGVVTCPDKESHEYAVMDEIKSAVNKTVSEKAGDNSLTNLIGGFIGSAITNYAVEPFVKNQMLYKNYFVFSICEATLGAETKPLSIGLFGHVFTTFKDEDILNAIKK